MKTMNNNNHSDATDGGSFTYEALAQPYHLLPAGIDKARREVRHYLPSDKRIEN